MTTMLEQATRLSGKNRLAAVAFAAIAALPGCTIEPMGRYHDRSVTTVVPTRGYYGGYYDRYYGPVRPRGSEGFVPYGEGYDPRTFNDRGNPGGRPYFGKGHDYACLPGRGCKKLEQDDDRNDWGYQGRRNEFDFRYR